MSLTTSILKSMIQASRPGPWRTAVTTIGTSTGLKIIKRPIFVGYRSKQYDLNTYLNICSPLNLTAIVRSISNEVVNLNVNLNVTIIRELPTYLFGIKPIDLQARIKILYKSQKDLIAYTHVFKNLNVNLNMRLHGWMLKAPISINASLKIIEPRNLIGAIRRCWVNNKYNLSNIIRGYGSNRWSPPDYIGGNLCANIMPYTELDFPASLNVILAANLKTYLKVWPYKNLQSYIYGYAILDLVSRIKIFTSKVSNISACTVGYYPLDLTSIICTKKSSYHDLISYTTALQLPVDLKAKINYIYQTYNNLNLSIIGLSIPLLRASIVGWAIKDLSVNIGVMIPPWYLNATLTQHGTYKNLIAFINGFINVARSTDLNSILSGWACSNIKASISTVKYISLMSSIVSKGGAKDISAYIKVKEIIFNELYKFSTINTADLRAYVGFSLCSLRTPISAYRSLLASISFVPIYDISATIEGIKTIFNSNKDLNVFISYTNKYTMMLKFLSFNYSMSVSKAIRINPAFSKNALNITFKIIKGQSDLKTYIVSEPHNVFLSASIHSTLLIINGFGTNKVLTEELVELNGYKRIWSEFVDIYLQTEKPIYYSGGKVFSKDYKNSIISFLFERVSDDGITYTYNLDHNIFFDSTDAAIRYGFSKITGRKSFITLGASIKSNVKHLKLNAKIKCKEKIPLYIKYPFIYLKSGTVSFMGTCINNILYKSKLNIFGGIQDIVSIISAVPN